MVEEEFFANVSGWEAVFNYVLDENFVFDFFIDLFKM